MKTCKRTDCPKVDDETIAEICEIAYPFGNKKLCQNICNNLIKNKKKVSIKYVKNKR